MRALLSSGRKIFEFHRLSLGLAKAHTCGAENIVRIDRVNRTTNTDLDTRTSRTGLKGVSLINEANLDAILSELRF